MTPEEEDEAYAALRANRDRERAKGRAKAPAKAASAKKSSKNRMSDEERRELIRAGLARKKECEDRAQKIVERLAGAHEDDEDGISPAVSTDWLEDATAFLTPSHYSDAVDERSLAGACGLATCSNRLETAKANKSARYRIDTRSNRVFDVTERNKYCSGDCFKRSARLASELSSEPLWMREEASKFRVRLAEAAEVSGVSGQGDEVALTVVSRRELREMNEVGLKEQKAVVEAEVASPPRSQVEGEDETRTASPPPKPVATKKRKSRPPPSADSSSVSPLEKVKSALSEWITLDTAAALASDSSELRSRLETEAGCAREEVVRWFGSKEAETASPEDELKRKLDDLALERQQEEEDEERAPAATPAPSSSSRDLSVREEAQLETKKVEAFYGGKTEYKLETEETKEASSRPPPVLPLLDRHSQAALRRRVFMEQARKVLPDVLDLCSSPNESTKTTSVGAVLGLVRRMASTFDLGADNVVLKPREWNLAAVALLILCSADDAELRAGLESKYVGMMLLSCGTDLSHLRGHLSGLLGDLKALADKKREAEDAK